MSGMIVAPQPLAVEEGAKVLARGGNAVDAAVTCAFAQMIVSPQMCGIGGYVLLNLRLAGSPAQSLGLDAPAVAGSLTSPDMWQSALLHASPSGWGYVLKGQVNTLGYTSICVPGTVRGLAAILQRWGTISWADAIAPAIAIAETGFTVDSVLAREWKDPRRYPDEPNLRDYILSNPEARRIYLKSDGAMYDTGERLRNPDYAGTLRQLANRGPEEFYTGTLSRRIADDLAANGSFVTAGDLADYHLREDPPLAGTYRGYSVATSNPPHGGPTLLAILNILEGYDLLALGHNSPAYIYLVSMAMKAAFADRNPYLADPAFVAVPTAWLTSKARAAEWRERIDAGEAISVSFAPKESPHTTHVSVVDAAGNAVALTHSLGSGSGVITPGLGFMYNNSMVNFHPLPGHPNSIAQRKGRTTGMSPTIIAKGDRPALVIGAPGATRIITSLAQVILNVLDFGMSVSDAVLAPRFDCQGDLISCQARIPEYVCAEVRKKHPIQRLPHSHAGLALVHAIRVDPVSGRLSGAADAGAGGMALEI